MERAQEIDHASIQKIIIIGLGLLMMNVVLLSCRSGHAKCSAYDQVENIPELSE
tara:strand:+ start:51444 stop:51605 length:162 start_codon:yes stop_codon:yes gene_type:complete